VDNYHFETNKIYPKSLKMLAIKNACPAKAPKHMMKKTAFLTNVARTTEYLLTEN
jgi:hypothetical protein